MPDNLPESEEQVITTVGLTLADLIDKFKVEQSDIQVVYDDKLTYETAVAKFRADNNLNETEEIPFPLFAFRRSVVRHVDDKAPGRRMGRMLVRQTIDGSVGQANVLRSVHGAFDIQWLYITPEIQKLEQFEIAYLAEEGLSADKELRVTLPPEFQSVELPYYVEYGILEEKQFETEGNFFKFLSGSAVIRGHYLVLRAQKSLITEINARIKDLMGPSIIYSNIQLTAD